MCCVMPPASPLATRVRRMESSSDVLPWSTWPITVTTGGRGSASDSRSRPCASASSASGSSSFAAFALWPISSTTIIAVSWSSTWLMVTIVPSFIITLMTSAALTDILWASSATRDRLGNRDFAHHRARAGALASPLVLVAMPAAAHLGPRQPGLAAVGPTSPRSLSARRRAASSWNTWPAPSWSTASLLARLGGRPMQRALGRRLLARLGGAQQLRPPPSQRLPRRRVPSWTCARLRAPAFRAGRPAGVSTTPAPCALPPRAAAISSGVRCEGTAAGAADFLRGRLRLRDDLGLSGLSCLSGLSGLGDLGGLRRLRCGFDHRRDGLDRCRCRLDHRRGASSTTGAACDFFLAPDQHALLAHLDLDRARLAGRVRRLDLRRLLARQRDPLLRLRRSAVLLAQVVEQARLVLLGELVAFLLARPRRPPRAARAALPPAS